jgi:RHS repeat-associated protein
MIPLVRYRYDSLDRLVDCALSDQQVQQFFYQRSRLASEIHGQVRYSYFQQPDSLLAQQLHDSAAHDTTLLACDPQRSVLHVLDNGWRRGITYAPYGHRATGGLLSLLGFNGERADPITGHYLLGNGYRAFNPSMMRFNSPDSMSPFAGGGLNAYAYCAGDPVNGTDPTGHFPLATLGAVAAFVGAGWVVTSFFFFASNDTVATVTRVVGGALLLGGLGGIGARAYRASRSRSVGNLSLRRNSEVVTQGGGFQVGRSRGPTSSYEPQVEYQPGREVRRAFAEVLEQIRRRNPEASSAFYARINLVRPQPLGGAHSMPIAPNWPRFPSERRSPIFLRLPEYAPPLPNPAGAGSRRASVVVEPPPPYEGPPSYSSLLRKEST